MSEHQQFFSSYYSALLILCISKIATHVFTRSFVVIQYDMRNIIKEKFCIDYRHSINLKPSSNFKNSTKLDLIFKINQLNNSCIFLSLIQAITL